MILFLLETLKNIAEQTVDESTLSHLVLKPTQGKWLVLLQLLHLLDQLTKKILHSVFQSFSGLRIYLNHSVVLFMDHQTIETDSQFMHVPKEFKMDIIVLKVNDDLGSAQFFNQDVSLVEVFDQYFQSILLNGDICQWTDNDIKEHLVERNLFAL